MAAGRENTGDVSNFLPPPMTTRRGPGVAAAFWAGAALCGVLTVVALAYWLFNSSNTIELCANPGVSLGECDVLTRQDDVAQHLELFAALLLAVAAVGCLLCAAVLELSDGRSRRRVP